MRFIGPGTLLIALSQSGETIDVLDAVRVARGRRAQIAALTNVEGSSLWRTADFTLPLGAGPARCVLATKPLTAKLATSLLTAHTLRGTPELARALLERAADDLAAMLSGPRRSALREVARVMHARDHSTSWGVGRTTRSRWRPR